MATGCTSVGCTESPWLAAKPSKLSLHPYTHINAFTLNPVIYHRCHVVAKRTKLSPEGLLGPRFVLEVKFSQNSRPERLTGVHLTNEARELIADGKVIGFSIEVLEDNTLASSHLGNADRLLTGVELEGGTLVCTIPKSLSRMRRWGLTAAISLACGALGWVLVAGQGLLPALLLMAATHAARSFKAIPAKAFPSLELHKSLAG